MLAIFLFSLILGGGLLLVSVLGNVVGGDGGLGAEADLDVVADGSADLPIPMDGAGPVVHGAPVDVSADATSLHASFTEAVRLFTIRNLTYFLFGFGGVGTALSWLSPGLPTWIVSVVALAAGFLTAGIAGLGFGYLRATDSGALEAEQSFVGCEARVVLPVRHGGMGQVVVRRGVREYELRALPFSAQAEEPERWRHVVVVEMEGGTARVSPLEPIGPTGADTWPAS